MEEWTRAEQAGSVEATFYLARHAERSSDGSRARELYARYLAESPDGAHAAEAGSSLLHLEGRRRIVFVWGGGAALLGAAIRGSVGVPAALRLDRRALAPRAARCAHAVRPVLGRLQHEVLKRGGLLLRGSGARLAAAPAETAQSLATRLYAPEGARTRRPPRRGAAALADLDALARANGAASTWASDPLFSPVVRGMGALAALEQPLRRVSAGGGDAAVARAVEQIDRAADLLSETTGRDIETMLDTVAHRRRARPGSLRRPGARGRRESLQPPPIAVTGLPGPASPRGARASRPRTGRRSGATSSRTRSRLSPV